MEGAQLWQSLLRMLLVFAVWGGVLAVAVAAGAPGASAEWACGLGIGLTLVARGALGSKRQAQAHPALERSAETSERRASV